MTNSTTEYWDVDGVSLQTMAFDIESWGGDRQAPPIFRGSDLTIPYAPGDLFIPKQVASRTMTFSMWVIGVNEDGTIPTGIQARTFETNFHKLRKLLWTPNRQFTLTKRFYVDNTLVSASTKAQFSGGINPTMTGRSRGTFDVQLQLSDPYFYGPEKNSGALTTGTHTITVGGDDITRAVKIHIAGPKKYTVIRNNTLGVQVELHQDLNSGDVADLDVKAFKSVTDPSAGDPYTSNGSIRHAGDAFWMLLQPGDNEIVISADSGIGAVTLTYQEAWL